MLREGEKVCRSKVIPRGEISDRYDTLCLAPKVHNDKVSGCKHTWSYVKVKVTKVKLKRHVQ